ncbi:MAG: DNA gyrase C-terminal beta-propeller domain-containing protein, partial [Polyangiales bacterium]
EDQVEAILELRLYKLAKLEILLIREELDQKRKEQRRVEQLLSSDSARWKLIRAELLELEQRYQDPRRTKIVGAVEEPEYSEEAFILEEDAVVLLSAQGWVKRQREMKDAAQTRLREGDQALDVVAGSTKSAVAFFSNRGACYVCRVNDIPASTGHGAPVQKLFKLDDGERIVRMLGMDSRVLEVLPETEGVEEPEPPYFVAVSRGGACIRGSLRPHREPSTRSGRRFMRVGDDDEVVYVGLYADDAKLACASRNGRALICEASEVALLAGPGKGVRLIKLDDADEVLGARLLYRPSDMLVVEKESGTELNVGLRSYSVVSRGGKGYAMFKRGSLSRVVTEPPVVPSLQGEGGS